MPYSWEDSRNGITFLLSFFLKLPCYKIFSFYAAIFLFFKAGLCLSNFKIYDYSTFSIIIEILRNVLLLIDDLICLVCASLCLVWQKIHLRSQNSNSNSNLLNVSAWSGYFISLRLNPFINKIVKLTIWCMKSS